MKTWGHEPAVHAGAGRRAVRRPVLRGVALNGYEQGAAGVYVFNYDYRHHRAGPREEETYNEDHLQLLSDLADPSRLARRDRSYSVSDSHLAGNFGHAAGDHRPQVPRDLSMPGRATGAVGYEMSLIVEDDIEAGRADGRISDTQLRLRLSNHEDCLDRIFCKVNDEEVELAGASTLENQFGAWLVVHDPPIKRGKNLVLVGLHGLQTPEPWPTLNQCEVMVLGCDGAGSPSRQGASR